MESRLFMWVMDSFHNLFLSSLVSKTLPSEVGIPWCNSTAKNLFHGVAQSGRALRLGRRGFARSNRVTVTP